MSKLEFSILKNPWRGCEKILVKLAEGRLTVSNNALRERKLKDPLSFLSDIGFCKDGGLAKKGEEYYKSKFILNEKEEAKTILVESIKKYEPVQLTCQILWGRQSLTRESIYRLLLLKKYINPELQPSNLSSFLMLLNYCGVLKYSKKFNKITILYNPTMKDEQKPPKRFLSPETPYSNIKALRECLRGCRKYIWWLDKHFSIKGLEPLSDEADGTKIKEIKILAAITNNINDKLKREFLRFQEEMNSRGVKTEFRIICDKDLVHKIHGRWIISKSCCFNIPPIDSIYKGQYDEIKETNSRPPFEEFWSIGLNLLENWKDITELKK
jgi:hypothetical protein